MAQLHRKRAMHAGEMANTQAHAHRDAGGENMSSWPIGRWSLVEYGRMEITNYREYIIDISSNIRIIIIILQIIFNIDITYKAHKHTNEYLVI